MTRRVLVFAVIGLATSSVVADERPNVCSASPTTGDATRAFTAIRRGRG